MAGLGDLLHNLHKGEARGDDEAEGGTASPAALTLDDVSRKTVGTLLGRVGERRAAAAARNRRAQETDSGRRGRGTKRRLEVCGDGDSRGGHSGFLSGSTIRAGAGGSAEPSRCGALAKTHVDEEVPIGAHRTGSGGDVEEPMFPQDVRVDKGGPDIAQAKDSTEDENSDWEEGELEFSGMKGYGEQATVKEWNGSVTLDMDGSVGNGSAIQKRPQRRATAKDKEFAEMVHKTHLLCMLARGRIVDAACNDPLVQASILSVLLPSVGLSIDSEVVTTKALGPIASWFMRSFRILSAGEGSSSYNQEDSQEEFSRRLLSTVQKQAGSAEEVAGLSVALLRGLGFTTRYVMVLDVASLKPDAESREVSGQMGSQLDEQGIVFSPQVNLETSKVASLARILARSAPQQMHGNHDWKSLKDNERVSPVTGGSGQDVGGRGKRGRPRRGEVLGSSKMESGRTSELGDDVLCSRSSPKGRGKGKGTGRGQGRSGSANGSLDGTNVASESEVTAPVKKRSGEDEFERHLAMAIAATGAVAESKNLPKVKTLGGESPTALLESSSPAAKKSKGIKGLGHASLRQKLGLVSKQEGGGSSGAVWSRKFGPVLHWAEVYCNAEEIAGGWAHVDAARGIIDGADKVQGAAAACRLPLRYVVAFAGSGAKDVTRRYVSLWSTISPLRVDEGWWDETLKPLRQLEAVATAGPALRTMSKQNAPSDTLKAAMKRPTSEADRLTMNKDELVQSSSHPERSVSETTATDARVDQTTNSRRLRSSKLSAPCTVDRSAIEDMEMETKTFTEPLPTNQQAYKSHHLYVLERWLTKYQTLYPKGPVLGSCAGHPVYPRTCVQTLHTPDRWLREGFKVKAGESPVKVIKASRVVGKDFDSAHLDPDGMEEKPSNTMTSLYGKWQTQEWQPPTAVNGIVPKNERGQVDAWSEKCIPPGTVHLRLPRLVPIAQKLEIDFAPAMVGFEVRKGRSFPVYDGIVVCEEFKDVMLDAYKFQEEARVGELWKKREEQVAKRWRHLLNSMGTRQRLQAAYEGIPTAGTEVKHSGDVHKSRNKLGGAELVGCAFDAVQASNSQPSIEQSRVARKQRQSLETYHVHEYLEENQSYDEESGIRTKRCSCGFTFHVEEM